MNKENIVELLMDLTRLKDDRRLARTILFLLNLADYEMEFTSSVYKGAYDTHNLVLSDSERSDAWFDYGCNLNLEIRKVYDATSTDTKDMIYGAILEYLGTWTSFA